MSVFKYSEHQFCHVNKRDFLANGADDMVQDDILQQGEKICNQNNSRCTNFFHVIFGNHIW